MFGIRTPAKKTKVSDREDDPKDSLVQVEQAGPSQKEAQLNATQNLNVRRSIGEWETGNTESRPSKTPSPPKKTAAAAPAKPKPKALVTRRLSVEAAESPPKPEKQKYLSKVSEAKACLMKAKQHLSNSKNLRTDIKIEVTQAVERLYELVKEADSGSVREKPPSKVQVKEKTMEKVQEKGKEEDDLKRTIEEHTKLLKESNKRMESLKEAMEKQKDILEKSTYANVAAAGQPRRQQCEQAVLHSVVVTSKDENDSGDQVLNRIREAVNAKDGWVTVDRVRKAKDRKVIVGCRTEGERQKIKERLEKTETHLHVEEIKNKDPLLILRDVLQYNSDEDVLKALRNQNEHIFLGLDKDENRVEIRYRKKTRNQYTCHIVLRVSPKIWNRMMDSADVRIDLQRIKVADQTPLVQCSLCLGYGHGRRFCKASVEKCSHCGGPHLKAECADWLAGVAPTCCNCRHARLDMVEHNAFSQECPVRRKWDTLARATIAYC